MKRMIDSTVLSVFTDGAPTETLDSDLLSAIAKGDRGALERLVGRHQPWVYNISVRMLGNASDAEDATQEILIKAITRLSTFRGDGEFRTWLYRIAKNHLLSMERRFKEGYVSSFARHAEILRDTPDIDLIDDRSIPVDRRLLVEETRHECMTGMLLCLDRTQRLVFILGGVFGISGAVASEITEMSAENFRQVLSRARRDLSNYMNDKCGLARPENPCRCQRKTKAMIERGYVDPDGLRFTDSYVERVNSFVRDNAEMLDEVMERRTQDLFRQMPFFRSPDLIAVLTEKLAGASSKLGGN